MASALLVAQPSNVPDELVFDIDMYNIPGMVDGVCDDVHAAWKAVQDSHPDMFWTPRHGGHWIITRHADMVELLTRPELFSSHEPFIPKGIIPHTGPSQLDAPEHAPFRKLVSAAFTPQGLKNASVRARKAAVEIIDYLLPRGRCNFMHDFAGVMPIVTFLNLLGLPESEQPYLHQLAERMTPGHPDMMAAQAEATAYIEDLIRDRQRNPREDFVTFLVQAQVMGRDLTPLELLNVVRLVVTGGLDTVINMTSFATTYFARHPEKQAQVRDHPELRDGAVEEITRRFGTSHLARLVKQDMEFGGQQLHAGEQVLGVFPLSGLDERVNPDPLEFDPARKARRHLNFGSGPHTCIGARLARREINIFVEEWMAMMPEFRIAPGTSPKMGTGIINTMSGLELEWDPA